MTQASSLSDNKVFATKLVLIILALLNAACFHAYTFKKVHEWDHQRPTTSLAKAAGIISIVLWTSVTACGRFLAYLE